MWKIEIEDCGNWIERDGRKQFCRESGGRLRLTLPRSLPGLVHELCGHLEPPFQLLYILHTSRGEGPLGRYQSPQLSRPELDKFFARFGDLLAGDGRHDLWIRSAASGAFFVWDRYNDVYVYGTHSVVEPLAALGFKEGQLEPLGLHQIHYRVEFDRAAQDLLSAFRWTRTGLRPEDEQYVPPVVNDL